MHALHRANFRSRALSQANQHTNTTITMSVRGMKRAGERSNSLTNLVEETALYGGRALRHCVKGSCGLNNMYSWYIGLFFLFWCRLAESLVGDLHISLVFFLNTDRVKALMALAVCTLLQSSPWLPIGLKRRQSWQFAYLPSFRLW